jgi:uncharacterized membrane protein
MKNLLKRAKHVVGGEEGASNLEIVVWIVVVLVIAVALFAFRDKISHFLGTSSNSVGDMDKAIDKTRSSVDW